jgi:hypothetical protein
MLLNQGILSCMGGGGGEGCLIKKAQKGFHKDFCLQCLLCNKVYKSRFLVRTYLYNMCSVIQGTFRLDRPKTGAIGQA